MAESEARPHKTNGVEARVIDYRLEGVADAEPIYRLVTTLLDHWRLREAAPARPIRRMPHGKRESRF